MKVTIANDLKKIVNLTYQERFPTETKCNRCDGEARLAFIAHEGFEKEASDTIPLCKLYENDTDGKGYWLHDFCCVAVYFCKKCLEPTALYNQA